MSEGRTDKINKDALNLNQHNDENSEVTSRKQQDIDDEIDDGIDYSLE